MQIDSYVEEYLNNNNLDYGDLKITENFRDLLNHYPFILVYEKIEEYVNEKNINKTQLLDYDFFYDFSKICPDLKLIIDLVEPEQLREFLLEIYNNLNDLDKTIELVQSKFPSIFKEGITFPTDDIAIQSAIPAMIEFLILN